MLTGHQTLPNQSPAFALSEGKYLANPFTATLPHAHMVNHIVVQNTEMTSILNHFRATMPNFSVRTSCCFHVLHCISGTIYEDKTENYKP